MKGCAILGYVIGLWASYGVWKEYRDVYRGQTILQSENAAQYRYAKEKPPRKTTINDGTVSYVAITIYAPAAAGTNALFDCDIVSIHIYRTELEGAYVEKERTKQCHSRGHVDRNEPANLELANEPSQ